MKLLIHTSYLSEYPVSPLMPPIDPSALTGRTLEVTSAYLDPFTGDWLLATDVSDPVDSIPPSLLELEPMQIESELAEV